jgi:DMSO/TMAO reductase YedYZ molybdopterin-dependent catalytic subunit
MGTRNTPSEIFPVVFPSKRRVPSKSGYKNAEHIHEILLTNTDLGGNRVEHGYNKFGGH